MDLPEPDAAAREHSARLSALLRERIAAAGGWISFADYMQAALYEPGLGYYSAGATKFGAGGDFVTAPEISPLFSACLAGQIAEVLQALGGGTVLEPGAGTGIMAADMLAELDRLGSLPERYLILERGADLRQRQAETLQTLPEHLRERVVWLDELPAERFRGVVVANEVLDALAVRRFCLDNNGVSEIGVMTDGEGFTDAARPADEALAAAVTALGIVAGAGYRSEISPDLADWVAALGNCLEAGAMLLLDYGFSRREYYLPERNEGTLRCYYRHRAHDDPYLWPGLQDITAWVDFTAVAAAATAAGLGVAGYTTQAQFLLAAGIDTRVAATAVADTRSQAQLAHGLRRLLLPGEMGDAVKVVALTRGTVTVPPAFAGRDMRWSL